MNLAVVGIAVGTAALMSTAGCSGYSQAPGPRPSPSTPTPADSRAATSAAPSAVLQGPTRAQISGVLRRTVEVATPGENFETPVQAPVTISDGRGGSLTAVLALRHPSADGKGMLVFFWHNHSFIGWGSNKEALVASVPVAAGPAEFRVTYADYARNDAACCPTLPSVTVTYHWKPSNRLVADRVIPPGVYGLNNPYAHALTVKWR